MEKKLPEDNLERFLRSSFEEFKQEPSGKVWDHIEAGLGSNPVPHKGIKPWMYWSAAASVLGVIIFFQFISNQSLNKKLEEAIQQNQILSRQDLFQPGDNASTSGNVINDQVNDQPANLKEGIVAEKSNQEDPYATPQKTDNEITSKDKQTGDKTVTAAENTLKTPDPANVTIDKLKSQKKIRELASRATAAPVSSEKSAVPPYAGIQRSKRTSELNSKKINRDGNLKKQPDQINHAGELIDLKKSNTVNDEYSAAADNSLGQLYDINEFANPLPERQAISVTTLDNQAEAIESSHQEKLFYSGGLLNPIEVSPQSAWRKATELSLLGGILIEKGEITPKRLFDPRVNDFPKNEYTSTNSWQAGFEVNQPLSRYFSLSGGIGLKHFEFINEFTQSLAFRNREQPNPGNLPFQHDFRCKLPGPSGTSDIIINSEQLDSRASISDAEQIKITIKNQSKLNYLTLPLSMMFQVNKGRWSVFAKTGFQADIYLSRTVDEPQITLSHPQLQLRQDRPIKPKANFRNSNFLVMNAAISAGIKYQLGSLWSVSLNPGIILPFSQREFNRDIQVDSRIYSLQFGINYTLSSL